MDEKNVVDVSSFMLFEATGDSEADSELNMASVDASYGRDVEPDYGDHDDDDDDEDDDDAESCSYNWLESKPIFELRDPRGQRDHNGDDDDDDDEKSANDQDWANVDDDRGNSHDGQEHHHVDDGDDDDDDDDEVVMKSTAKTRQHKKPRLCADSTMGLMNEMEKSRLFWEACFAS
ncbi:hypothetical protein Vadar_003811 [Vaccinium darrowii]|uniref:Uncharacterized protein n=1 Tax=Vaccinium darrowii TaxID=229202 RepID=A0ACB7ZAB5_9ERIC|nr:hypothetical protein Vadar_003811 [Vaccinium darrowii]